MPTQVEYLNQSIAFDVFQVADKSVKVAGFASVQHVDRDGDVAFAQEFDIETYLNSPALLFNHEMIKDQFGNQKAAGHVEMAVPAYIEKENPEDSSVWIVKSIATDEFVALWPKEKSPQIEVGDRGLFVIAEVTHPEVVKRVKNGELGAFSWRGFSRATPNEFGGNDLKSIDLIEISVVNMPCQNQSTFKITSEADPTVNMELALKDCVPYRLKFNKSKYSYKNVQSYTKKFSAHKLSHTNDAYYVDFGDTSLIDCTKSFALPLGDQMTLIAAPKDEEKISVAEHVGQIKTNSISEDIDMSESKQAAAEERVDGMKLYLLDYEALKTVCPNAATELLNDTSTVNDAPAEIYTVEFPLEEVIEKSETTEVAAENAVTEEVAEESVKTEVKTEPAQETSEESSKNMIMDMEMMTMMMMKLEMLEQAMMNMQKSTETAVEDAVAKTKQELAAKEAESARKAQEEAVKAAKQEQVQLLNRWKKQFASQTFAETKRDEEVVDSSKSMNANQVPKAYGDIYSQWTSVKKEGK